MRVHKLPPKGFSLTECGLTSVTPREITSDPDECTCGDCRTAMMRRGVCPVCETEALVWGTHPRNKSGVTDGRLRLSETETIFYLACEYCSETLIAQVPPDEVATYLTGQRWVP